MALKAMQHDMGKSQRSNLIKDHQHNNTNKMTWATRKDLDQHGTHQLIAVSIKNAAMGPQMSARQSLIRLGGGPG